MSYKSEAFTGIDKDWIKILDTPDLEQILETVNNIDMTPKLSQIFEFARLTTLKKIKVVILGQDPYPRRGDAHGLAFSCLSCVPPSLRNIYKCLVKSKLINEIPESGNLTYWANQGVLLLNSALTTSIGKPNAHSEIWNNYIANLLRNIAIKKPLIYMLWGNNAKSYEDLIVDANNSSFIYTWSHPSPLAQSKQSFTECPHFIDANKLLMKLGHEPIDWNTETKKSEVEICFHAGPKTQVVFTDGSCMPNKSCPESKAGYAAVFALGTMKDVILYGNIERDKVYASNQRGEGMAIWRVMLYLKEHINEWETVIIVSDSEFWINMFEKYMPSWANNDLFSIKKNPDMTKPMYKLYTELLSLGKNINFRHMKSHNKDGWNKKDENSYEYFCYINNNYVDELAGYARKEMEPGKHIVSSVTYDE